MHITIIKLLMLFRMFQLGSLMMLRAVLGPGIFVKLFFSLHYLFDARFEIREKIGDDYKVTYVCMHVCLCMYIYAILILFIFMYVND